VCSRSLKIPHSVTLEISFAGADVGCLKGNHFSASVLREIGAGLCRAILDCCCEPATVEEQASN
jgi:hypothetical protein